MTIIICPVPKRLWKTEVSRLKIGHRDCERVARQALRSLGFLRVRSASVGLHLI